MIETKPEEAGAFTFWTPRHFRSAKTPSPILAASRMHEDYLSLKSLEEDVESISESPAGIVETPVGFEPDYEVIEKGGRRTFVHVLVDAISDAEKASLMDAVGRAQEKGVTFHVVGETWINVQPRLRNARMVFSSRRTKVSPSDRIRILHHLDEHGEVQILDLAKVVTANPEPIECVLALVAEGSVMVDIESTLAPETTCWRIGVEPAED